MPTVTNLGPCDCCETVCEACDPNDIPPNPHVTFVGGGCECASPGATIPLQYVSPGVWMHRRDACGVFTGRPASDPAGYLPGFQVFVQCVDSDTLFIDVSWWIVIGGIAFVYSFSATASTSAGGNSCDPLSVTFTGFTFSGSTIDPPCPGGMPTSAVLTL